MRNDASLDIRVAVERLGPTGFHLTVILLDPFVRVQERHQSSWRLTATQLGDLMEQTGIGRPPRTQSYDGMSLKAVLVQLLDYGTHPRLLALWGALPNSGAVLERFDVTKGSARWVNNTKEEEES